MTGWDILKFDVRVRQRMMAKQLLTPAQLQRHLDELPDVEGRCDAIGPQQPAVGMRGVREAYAGGRMGIAQKAPAHTDAGNDSAPRPDSDVVAPRPDGGAEVGRSSSDEDMS
ncbi:MAG: hypothetical protein JW940_01630 [Polyangiaceae bacterium]|nr:hypothetical protein [Polyangiaceae bacterium]